MRFMGISNGKNSRFPGPPRAGGICHEGFDEYDDESAVVEAFPVEVGAKAEAELRRAKTEATANFMIKMVMMNDKVRRRLYR